MTNLLCKSGTVVYTTGKWFILLVKGVVCSASFVYSMNEKWGTRAGQKIYRTRVRLNSLARRALVVLVALLVVDQKYMLSIQR